MAQRSPGLAAESFSWNEALKRDSGLAILCGFVADPFGFGQNNLQGLAQMLCPGVNEALAWFESLGLKGRMTGSGSAVFAPLTQDTDIADGPAGFEVWVCNNVAVHGLARGAVRAN